MSPPDRTPADPKPDVAIASRERTEGPAQPATELDSAHAAILATQQAAGNKALASVLGGGARGVQRAPNDDDPRRISGMAHAPTLDPRPAPSPNVASPLAVAPTSPPTAPLQVSSSTMASGAPAPGAPAGLQVNSNTMDSSAPAPGSPGGGPGGPAGTPGPAPGGQPGAALFPYKPQWWQSDPRFAVGGEYGPSPTPPGMYGGRAKPVSVDPTPIAVNPGLVESAYRQDPTRVIRSPNTTWHEEAWDKSKGPATYGKDTPPPHTFSDGRFYYVAPNYQGNATTLPSYAAVGDVGLGGAGGAGGTGPGGTGAPGGPGGASGGPVRPRILDTHGPDAPDPAPNRLRQAVAPETPFSGPRGSQKAQSVTFSEVAAAMAENPGKVVRSPNDGWHRQGYKLDGGGRYPPGAFKVGDLYVISPDYPLKGVPKLGESAPPKPSTLPQAIATVTPGGTTYSEGSTARSYTATTTQSGGRTETRTQVREQAVVTTATEVSEGGITNRQEKVRGGGFGVGGNLLGVVAGNTETSKIEGDAVAAKKSTVATGGIGKDLKLGAELKSTKEIVTGTDPEGNPVKQSTATKATGKADFEGWQAGASRDRTSAKGNTVGAGGGLKGDWKGNVEVEAFVNLQTKGGVSFKPTVSHGIKVEASEPIKVPGGYDIVYRIIETTGAGIGGGKQMGGGASVSVNVGATEAEFQGGRRTFKTEAEANAFRDNAAAKVATEQMAGVALPPTTVAGALQIPEGETRTTGDISGKSIGAGAGAAGVAVNIGKSKSTTTEMAVKRIGPSMVEVTGSLAGSKTGTVGISAPVLSHGYSSTETTSFAVTFEFDLSKEQGRAAFELYVKTGWPPGKPKVIEKGGSQADNETFAIPGLGTVVWTGTTWQVSRETSDGSLTSVYGGAQIHEQKPGAIGKVLGEDTLKSNAQIVRVVQDGEEVGAKAQFQVSGTSGEYNRAEFGKIFSGAKAKGDVKPSGQWALSAPIPKENIEELHRVSKHIGKAIDERQAYSELVKEHGAGMLGGQVGSTSKEWDLELKGDSNFPGEPERVRLKELRKVLMGRVKSNPEMAAEIIRETGDELAKLAKRRAAVADLKRYTDLPDGLRQQQLSVIDMHVDDMKVVRRTAQAVAMKKNAGERAADVATRVDKQDQAAKARPGKKAGSEAKKTAVEDEAKKADAEYANLQDRVTAKTSKTAAKRNDIREFSKALGDAIGPKGTTAVRFGADTATVQVAIASGKGYIGAATEADKKQAALDPEVERLRDAWSATTERSAQLAALNALEKVLDERLKLMELCLYYIREAGKAVFHITTKSAKSASPYFWLSLGLVDMNDD